MRLVELIVVMFSILHELPVERHVVRVDLLTCQTVVTIDLNLAVVVKVLLVMFKAPWIMVHLKELDGDLTLLQVGQLGFEWLVTLLLVYDVLSHLHEYLGRPALDCNHCLAHWHVLEFTFRL